MATAEAEYSRDKMAAGELNTQKRVSEFPTTNWESLFKLRVYKREFSYAFYLSARNQMKAKPFRL